ncbi:membrane or secreted protein [Filimonas effusa]|uniref:Membrane or secreted protein n=1 Tax=Filimonas effusa TaxID=2508721 RepID=A0A4Q1D604_9BACT|nr:membrane or secreted protein [Filimonas effusa]
MFIGLHQTAFSQRNVKTAPGKPLVYVDKKGILRYTADNKEAAFFGVNYTVPFAHGYRAHKALGIDLKKAIDADVYHFARLGLDAFRVHVWDTEIADANGNLLLNEHLNLFDYLLAKLKERNIRIFITPIAFWGNGYPEKDENNGSFSYIYGKRGAVVNDTAIRAQENYLKQFFAHVNPYTGLSYTNDPDVIATEINNEPNHSGPLAGATSYVNRLAAAIRSAGWKKPVFYNISESPYYAAAIAAANIDGVSFQWYPTGLLANHALQNNVLPNVDNYAIPYDTIPAFKNKARMIYEFDAADVMQPIMYPAMARSFRTAGFQWATQFAYDPMYTAYCNTEYQTHYLNLAYTPAKAISLLIAGKAFHTLPLYKSYGAYPADTLFGATRISYHQQLSEWNTINEFYYTGNTATQPLNLPTLQHVAGTGSSPVVKYKGTGAYFLDKISEGVWRLELMPDVIALRDPFGKSSPSTELRRMEWNTQQVSVLLPDLGEGFSVSAASRESSTHPTVLQHTVALTPGTYILTANGKTFNGDKNTTVAGAVKLGEFAAPQPFSNSVFVNHTPFREAPAGQPLLLQATITSIPTSGLHHLPSIYIEGACKGGPWFNIRFQDQGNGIYTVTLPDSLLQPGRLDYRIVVHHDTNFIVFPGNYKGDPYAWDNLNNEYYHTNIAAPGATLSLIDVASDNDLFLVPSWPGLSFTSGATPAALAVCLKGNGTGADSVSAVSRVVAADIKARLSQHNNFSKVVIRARVVGAQSAVARVGLISSDAVSFAAHAKLAASFSDIELPLSSFQPAPALLLPRPYPGFMPWWFQAANAEAGGMAQQLSLQSLDRVEVSNYTGADNKTTSSPYTIEIESLWLKK